MAALIRLGLGVLSIFSGVQAFGCASVGLSSGFRVLQFQCYADAGGVASWLVGSGMIGVGLFLIAGLAAPARVGSVPPTSGRRPARRPSPAADGATDRPSVPR
jgi:hypothetical protein